jgi:GNAT superfamily N-acetyltransferase
MTGLEDYSTMNSLPDTLVTTYLHMTRPEHFMPSFVQRSNLLMLPMRTLDVNYYRFLYKSVGERWRWRDRLSMPDEELRRVLASDTNMVNVMYVDGVPAGYIELEREGNNMEIAYFGLRPGYFGQGLGKHLLSVGIAKAWESGAQRVWVHTCNLDGPHALKNYEARGFVVYDVTEEPMPQRYL